MISTTETSDELSSSCSLGGASSSGEEIITTKLESGGGDGQITLKLQPQKTTRLSSYRFGEKRNNKKTKKILTSKINSTSQKLNNNLTKIPRPSSARQEKLNNNNNNNNKIIGKNLQYKIEIEKSDCFIKPQEKLKYMLAQRNFKSRKSFSQMDINHLKYIGRNHQINNNNRDIIPVNYQIKPYITSSKQLGSTTSGAGNCIDNQSPPQLTSLERSSIMLTEDYYNFIRETEKDEIDSKIAGMRVFATIMLNAWRRRRDDVKRLNDEVIRARKSAIKVKNQIHVLNSLFKIEQKQNDELNGRLRRMMDDQRKIHDLYDELNNSFIELKTSNQMLSDSLLNKDRDLEGLEMILKDTKSRVFKLMVQERELENNLSNEQRKVQELQNNKNELMTTITQLQFELCEKQVAMKEIIYSKDQEINKSGIQILNLEKKILDLRRCEKERKNELQEIERIELIQKNEIILLQDKINELNIKINSFITNRIKNSWITNSLPSQSFKLLHVFTYYLLPAIPPPINKKFPGFGIKTAINYVWGI